MIITWSLSTVVGDNGINDNEKCRESAGDFDHCPMEHILGFTRSHWMPSLGKCLCGIAPQRLPWLANMLKTHKTLQKTIFS
jgi:hypothetical protein